MGTRRVFAAGASGSKAYSQVAIEADRPRRNVEDVGQVVQCIVGVIQRRLPIFIHLPFSEFTAAEVKSLLEVFRLNVLAAGSMLLAARAI